ncbi:MAG: hypothetical protein Kow0075_01100 [Salibacteraceae bacterium]
MKAILLTLGIALVATACDQSKTERVTEAIWSPEQPKIVAIYRVKDEERTRIGEERYYENGQLEYTGEFNEKGQRHGLWKYYYKNGNLWSEGRYDNGKKTGLKKVYWPDGTLRFEGQYANDKQVGVWTFYNPDGTVLHEKDFGNGTDNR